MNPTTEEICTKATPVFKKYGVKRARLFGSFARGEAGPDSDIDLLVELQRPLGFEFFEFEEQLAAELKREVDVVTEGSVNKFLRPYIVSDLKLLYEEK